MSQFWHAHWAEDSYKPSRLGNWQVPNWHPKFPCRHCTTTTFLADSSGRLLADLPRPKKSPWGNYKGTWELPLKIDRKLAQILSAPPKYKIAAWEAHKKYHQGPCKKTELTSTKTDKKPTAKKFVPKNIKPRIEKMYTGIKRPVVTSGQPKSKNVKTTASRKPENIFTHEKNIQNVEQKEIIEDKGISAQDQNDDQLNQKDHFKPLIQEHNIEKSYSEEPKEQEKLGCLCVHKNAAQSPEQFAQKAIRRNICIVHQRLRV